MKKAVMITMLMPLMALATTWYVDGTNGSDSYSGMSQSAAKKTIQAAIDASSDGDKIFVAAGTYTPILVDNKDIAIIGTEGATRTVIDGNGSQRCACLAEGVDDTTWETNRWNTKLIGFTLQNGYARDTADGRHGDGAAVVAGTVSECIIRNCDGKRSIAFAENLNNCLVVNNRSDWSIMMHGEARNCTIIGNDADDCAWDHALQNCIVIGNGSVSISSGNTGAYCYSCVFDKSLPKGSGNVIADPKFVDAVHGDYRLAADSPCIDAGDNSYVVGDADLDGKARIVNGTVDIGCYDVVCEW